MLSMACASTPDEPPATALVPLGARPAQLPEPEEALAASIAAHALISDTEGTERALEALREAETLRSEEGEAPTGLVPFATELHATLQQSGADFRDEARELLARDDLAETQRRRLEREVARDPLRHADRHLRDARMRRFGGAANSLVEPVGRSIATGNLLPIRVLQALVRVGVREHVRDSLSPEERMALHEWKEFVEANPDDPRALELIPRIERNQRRWYETQRQKNLKLAEEALDRGEAQLAVALAERTLRYAAEDPEASRVLEEAKAQALLENAERARSLEATAHLALDRLEASRRLTLALLGAGDIAGEAIRLREAVPELADEAAFAEALAASEAGEDDAAWKSLRKLGEEADEDSNMARHAAVAWSSPDQNPLAAHRAALRTQRSDQARWLFFGHLAKGARDRDLPRALEWAIELPSVPQVVTNFPGRLIQFPWVRPKRRSPAVFAEMYLEKYPGGEHADEVSAWLEKYEHSRGNYVGALRIAEKRGRPAADLAELREKAGKQAFDNALGYEETELRHAMLSRAAKNFADTEGGEEAGQALREELADTSPQEIRLSRDFLRENPEVVGPRGLGLRPELIDGRKSNGELHPEGIAMLGGRVLEISYATPKGGDSGEPETRREAIGEERLARFVATLDETSRRLALTDPDLQYEHDADRDRYFERARLGLTHYADMRPRARSSYVYEGVQEKFGLVRGRESILPIELVLQGSIGDLGLGAFPRVRLPRRDPDVILYR